MPPVQTAESGTYRPFTKLVGSEPLPGYRLLEPLGRGGFGEVWKCEAPGGLLKAIKFVSGEETEDGRGEQRLLQELGAFEQMKTIRHPFLLTLERVEVIGSELVMVMELADRQLHDRFRECKTCGLPGIPRDELLAYFADAAEALDVIAAKYELQHLDVKPANLFLVAGHVKIGDYGLVSSLQPSVSPGDHRGLTPKYVAPEVLRGQPCARSDQYSLALVYQELLTGTFPYDGKTPQQLIMHHISTKPSLGSLPSGDRPIVRRALAKKPDERYSSCLSFVQALMMAPNAASPPSGSMAVRRSRVERSIAEMNLPVGERLEDGSDGVGESTGGRERAEATQNVTLPVGPQAPMRTPPPAVPGTPPPRHSHALYFPKIESGSLPQLVTNRKLPGTPETPPPQSGKARPISLELDAANLADEKYKVRLTRIRAVLPVTRLLGEGGDERRDAAEYVNMLVNYAAAGATLPETPEDIGRLVDGTWVCRFPSTTSLAVVPLKLIVLHERWGVSIDQPDAATIVLRKTGGGGFWGNNTKKSGLEIIVSCELNPGKVGEITISGTLFGTPNADFVKQAREAIPHMIKEIRGQLGNYDDRRKHPRVQANFPVTLYPIHSAGGVDEPIYGRVRDISLGGIGVVTEVALPTKYAFGVFDEVEETAGFAVLIRFIRKTQDGAEFHLGGQFRVDL
jgi:eukaryotic-like serine/threonine-protein kinase